MRADSTNGYVCEFQVYVGKEKGSSEYKLGERVIKDLTRKLKYKYYHVYCDNFFTSFSLFRDLLANGLYACGTVRTHHKGFPNDLKHYITYSQLERGESVTLQCVNEPNMIATVWLDTKLVTATSTNAEPLPHNEVARRMKTEKDILMPSKYYLI